MHLCQQVGQSLISDLFIDAHAASFHKILRKQKRRFLNIEILVRGTVKPYKKKINKFIYFQYGPNNLVTTSNVSRWLSYFIIGKIEHTKIHITHQRKMIVCRTKLTFTFLDISANHAIEDSMLMGNLWFHYHFYINSFTSVL